MDDTLRTLLDDVEAETVEAGDAEAGDAEAPAGPEVAAAADRLIQAHFAAEPPSATFLAALDRLGQVTAFNEAPAGRAAASASRARSVRGETVSGAIAATIAQARGALVRNLHIGADAADLLLDRPAAALMAYPAARIAAVADLCGRLRGELFRAVADSARSSGGFVYAYRPGPAPSEPATRAAEEPDQIAEIAAWGRESFNAPSSSPQTSR